MDFMHRASPNSASNRCTPEVQPSAMQHGEPIPTDVMPCRLLAGTQLTGRAAITTSHFRAGCYSGLTRHDPVRSCSCSLPPFLTDAGPFHNASVPALFCPKVELVDSGLDDVASETLLGVLLGRVGTITKLDLARNRIGARGAAALSRFIKHRGKRAPSLAFRVSPPFPFPSLSLPPLLLLSRRASKAEALRVGGDEFASLDLG